MKLEGGERLVLKVLRDLQGDSNDYVHDARLAAATGMRIEDVRDWMETLEGKGLVERARIANGFSAYATARGKQVLRLTEPIRTDKEGGPQTQDVSADLSTVLSDPLHAPHGQTSPITLFYSYSHKDERLRRRLEEHISLLHRQGFIVGWHDRKIGAGEEWRGVIDERLEGAEIILLLVSSSFIASDYCWDIEAKRAVQRHDSREARVIPVILRACDWQSVPFGKLQALPRDGKAVMSWPNRDEAWTDVALGIRRAVEALTSRPH